MNKAIPLHVGKSILNIGSLWISSRKYPITIPMKITMESAIPTESPIIKESECFC